MIRRSFPGACALVRIQSVQIWACEPKAWLAYVVPLEGPGLEMPPLEPGFEPIEIYREKVVDASFFALERVQVNIQSSVKTLGVALAKSPGIPPRGHRPDGIFRARSIGCCRPVNPRLDEFVTALFWSCRRHWLVFGCHGTKIQGSRSEVDE